MKINELQTTLDNILNDKNTNLLPENLKKGITLLGIEGSLETGVMTNADYQTCLSLSDDIMGNPAPSEGKIYGIKRLRTSSGTSWERTDDGRGLVANATHDGTEVQNDFDNLYPWSEIISFDYDSTQNLATAYYGDDDFTFSPTETNVNVFTKIPRFWYKRYEDDDGYEHIEIADYAAEGFNESKEFAIARYPYQNSTSVPRSISGLKPLVSTAGTNYRTGARGMSEYICLLDWRALGALQLLYLVEYADYNSQDKLGNGISSGSVSACGQLDSLGMKSGCVNNDSAHSVIYRGVEDIFAHVWQIVDGVNIQDGQAYVCNDYTKYAFDTFDGDYASVGYIDSTTSDYISKLGLDKTNSLLMLPIACSGASSTTHITDYYYYSSGNKAFRAGGLCDLGTRCGLFATYCSFAASTANGGWGARLLLRNHE